jgi:hypothetical protein
VLERRRRKRGRRSSNPHAVRREKLPDEAAERDDKALSDAHAEALNPVSET